MAVEMGAPDASRDDIDALTLDLRVLRERGLTAVRDLPLPALAIAVHSVFGVDVSSATVQRLLVAAVDRFGGDRAGDAAQYCFGLVQGTKFWPASQRRRAAAQAQGVSVERFRKGYEPNIIRQVAEEITALVSEVPKTSQAGAVAARSAGPGDDLTTANAADPAGDEIRAMSALLVARLGRRRTAYPLDMSLGELVRSGLAVDTRIEHYSAHRQSPGPATVQLPAVLGSGRSCLLLGEPGAGKTLVLYRAALACEEAGLIPVVLRAGDIEQLDAESALWAVHQTPPGPVVVLLDGLDEALAAWSQVGALPSVLTDTLSRFPCLVTSRTRDFESSALLYQADVVFDEIYRLEPWRVTEEFREYVERLSSSGRLPNPDLYEMVERSPEMTRVASRPLHARMLTFVSEGGSVGRFSDSITLYGEYVAKLARIADGDMRRRSYSMNETVLKLWQRFAWEVHQNGSHAEVAVDLKPIEGALLEFGPIRCIRSALDYILDRRDTAGREVGDFIHYSFYEYLLAGYVTDALTARAAPDSIVEACRIDLSREMRHYLIGQLRSAPSREVSRNLVDAYRLACESSGLTSEEVLIACNLISYLISRTATDAAAKLRILSGDEEHPFLRVSLLWGLCHLGDMCGMTEFWREMERSAEIREIARGYVLYYYGDLPRTANPPYLDSKPYRPLTLTPSKVLRMLRDPGYAATIQPARQFVDIYSFVDVMRVRDLGLASQDKVQLLALVRGLADADIDASPLRGLTAMIGELRLLEEVE
ncbi:NACHT domain-containing protein [Streptomyces sp. NPDC004561]